MRAGWLCVALCLIGAGFVLRYQMEKRPYADLPPGSLITVRMGEDLDARETHLGARFEALVLQPVHVAGLRVLSPGERLGGRVEGLLARNSGEGATRVSGMVLRFDRVQSGGGRHEAIATRPIVWPPQSLGGLLGTDDAPPVARLMLDELPQLPRGQKLTVEIVTPDGPRIQSAEGE